MKQKLVLISILFLLASPGYAQDSMMADVSYPYLEKLIDLAKKNYPEIKVRKQQVAIAKNLITRTAVSWLDAFSFSYFYRPEDKSVVNPVNPYIFNGYQIGVNLNIGTLLQKPFATKEAKEQYKMVQFQQQEYDLTLEAQVKARYFSYLQQKSLLKLRTKSSSDASDLVKQLRTKFERGEAKFDEYNNVLIVATDQNQYKIIAEGGMLTAKAQLEELIGEKLENVQ